MGYTLQQRLAKQPLLRADRELTALTISTEKIELQEREVIPWIFERMFTYKNALAEAQKAGKLEGKEKALLMDADGTPRLFAYWADFWKCLCETLPTIQRLSWLDSMTEGKGLSVYDPAQETGAKKRRSTAAGGISN